MCGSMHGVHTWSDVYGSGHASVSMCVHTCGMYVCIGHMVYVHAYMRMYLPCGHVYLCDHMCHTFSPEGQLRHLWYPLALGEQLSDLLSTLSDFLNSVLHDCNIYLTEITTNE
jgi:hypothetical protein